MRGSRKLPPPTTVSIVFVHGLLSGLRARGHAPDAWLARAGIAPALLEQSAARVTADQYVALSRVVVADIDDEGLGLFSRPLRRGAMALMTRSVLGATTVGIALRRFCRAFGLLQDDVSLSVSLQPPRACLRIEVPPPFDAERAFVHEMVLSVLLRLLFWLHGSRVKALAFDLATPRPRHAAEYERLFPGEVRFAQPCTAIWFDDGVLAQPLRRDEPALRDFIAHTPDIIVAPRRNSRSASARVRACLEAARPRWLELADAADALHLSVSTLQRHLTAEDSSFQAVKDQLRRDLAIARLITSNVPMAALADELGFSDSGSFQRAFKDWTGSAPGVYRRAAGGASDQT